jgi:ATP-dependent exoDNAse (exonuclease V) beta subunit
VIACLDALAAMSDPTDDRALFFLAASEIYGVPALAIAELRRSAERGTAACSSRSRTQLALGAYEGETAQR